MILIEAEPLKVGEVALEAVSNGNLDQMMKQVITMGIDAGKSILLALVIFIVGHYVVKFINHIVARTLERRKVDLTIQSFLRSFINILLMILLIITVVSALGINTTSFAALLASAGVAVGMALSGNLQNLAGGLILLLFKPYKVGDFVEAQGVSGTVKAIQIFHTIITTTDNKEVFIPNGALSSGTIKNFSRNELRRVDQTVSVEYGTDVEKVRQAVLDLAKADKRILTEPEAPAPFVELGELADSSVNFTVRLWVKTADYWGVWFDMNRHVYEEFNRRGIGFPFPQIQVHQS